MFLKYTLTFVAVLAMCHGTDNLLQGRRHTHNPPFETLDKFSHALSHHYLWPWTQLMKAAAALDAEDSLEEPQITTDRTKFQIKLDMKRFKPEELAVKVKNRYIILEGKHKEATEEFNHFIANQFTQRFILPAGSKPEEVTAVFKENNVLLISAPMHPLPPEIKVPIVVEKSTDEEQTTKPEEESKVPEETTTRIESSESSTEKKVENVSSSPSTQDKQVEIEESTAHVGKIRKKELKTTKTTKDNEVTKDVYGNVLDLMETEE